LAGIPEEKHEKPKKPRKYEEKIILKKKLFIKNKK
jgi:hypothetical protein